MLIERIVAVPSARRKSISAATDIARES